MGKLEITICDFKLGRRSHTALRLHRTGRRHAFQRSESDRAVQVNIEIMRAFVRLRQLLASNADLARKLETLEKKYDAQFKVVVDAIRQLMSPPVKPKREIGFHVKYDDDKPKAKKR
jgi:hypothetical protein